MQPLDGAGPLAAALGHQAVLVAGLEQDLHADADAEHRPATRQPPADDLRAAHVAEPGHAGGEGAHAGHDQPVARLGCRPVAGDDDVGSDPGEGALGGAQVAGAVVEDDDARAGHPPRLREPVLRRALDRARAPPVATGRDHEPGSARLEDLPGKRRESEASASVTTAAAGSEAAARPPPRRRARAAHRRRSAAPAGPAAGAAPRRAAPGCRTGGRARRPARPRRRAPGRRCRTSPPGAGRGPGCGHRAAARPAGPSATFTATTPAGASSRRTAPAISTEVRWAGVRAPSKTSRTTRSDDAGRIRPMASRASAICTGTRIPRGRASRSRIAATTDSSASTARCRDPGRVVPMYRARVRAPAPRWTTRIGSPAGAIVSTR